MYSTITLYKPTPAMVHALAGSDIFYEDNGDIRIKTIGPKETENLAKTIKRAYATARREAREAKLKK